MLLRASVSRLLREKGIPISDMKITPSSFGMRLSSRFSQIAASTKRRRESEWLMRWWAMSGLNSWRMGTATTPAVRQERKATIQLLEFLPRIATLSPGFSPACSNRMCILAIMIASSLYL